MTPPCCRDPTAAAAAAMTLPASPNPLSTQAHPATLTNHSVDHHQGIVPESGVEVELLTL